MEQAKKFIGVRGQVPQVQTTHRKPNTEKPLMIVSRETIVRGFMVAAVAFGLCGGIFKFPALADIPDIQFRYPPL